MTFSWLLLGILFLNLIAWAIQIAFNHFTERQMKIQFEYMLDKFSSLEEAKNGRKK